MTEPAEHRPVLLDETLRLLEPRAGDTVVDATVGAGGHAEALLRAVGPGGRLIGIDRDPAAVALASRRLAQSGGAFRVLLGNHRDLHSLLRSEGIDLVDRILLDLGVSSMQLDDPERGFSLRADGPLDMRMDRGSGVSAADLLADLPEAELRELLWRYGEEKRSREIARAIVREREQRPLLRTLQLARLVETVLGPAARRYRIHPATRTFQALRIAVNREIEGLESFVIEAIRLLRRGGRLAVISFHSLEDRPVKRALKLAAHQCVCPPRLPVCGCGRKDLVRIVTTRPVRPSAEEVGRNPRARSAKLRVAERL